MREITTIITAEITMVSHGEPGGPITEERKRAEAEELKALLGADDVVVTRVQEFGA